MKLTENHYLLWLMNNQNITSSKAAYLLSYFKSAENIFEADADEIGEILKQKSKQPEGTLSAWRRNRNTDRIYGLIEKLDNIGMKFVTRFDSNYPALLNETDDAPILLYYIGTIPDDRLPCISIIGTRKCTQYGLSAARMLGRDLAKFGVTIVSGMAEGVDSSAHIGALDSNGYTIAVLGCGADICYPACNRNLRDKIIENGCVMSEYPPGTPPLPAYFPQRNRIISGLSYALIVTEADERSGTSITANFALEQGREVFAVPGSIFSPKSRGTNDMIKNGAYPVTNYNDIIFFLAQSKATGALQLETVDSGDNPAGDVTYEKDVSNLSDDEKLLYSFIEHEPITVDELLILSDMTVQNALGILTKLEFKGYIKRLPGQKCIRNI